MNVLIIYEVHTNLQKHSKIERESLLGILCGGLKTVGDRPKTVPRSTIRPRAIEYYEF